MLISHDRAFLDNLTKRTIEISMGRIYDYAAPYTKYLELRKERREQQQKQFDDQAKQIAEIEQFIERFRYKASKARQAQSRLKAIEKLQPVAEMVEQRVAPFLFANPKRPLNPPLIRFEDAAAGYTEGHPVLRHLNLRIDSDDRIDGGAGSDAIAGDNADICYRPDDLDPREAAPELLKLVASERAYMRSHRIAYRVLSRAALPSGVRFGRDAVLWLTPGEAEPFARLAWGEAR